MSDNRKSLEKLLFSAIGVIGVLVILVAANSLLSRAKVRLDVTQDRVNTLSDGTKAILKGLDTDVTIRFYYTQSENAMPVYLRNYAERVKDVLDSYKQAGGKHIRIEILDPQPDSDAEDSANLDGIPAQPLPNSMDSAIYFGIAFACVDQKATIPFLIPDREPLLEYDISSKIAEVTTVKKPVIGIMTSLPMFGQQMPPQFGGQGGQPKWIFLESLESKYDVRRIEMNAEEIPAEISTLMVAHPTEISEGAQYAIDQFLLRGGNLAVLVDPLSAYNYGSQQQSPMMMGPPPESSSDLPKLFEAWGVKYDKSQVIADRVFKSMMGGGPGGAPQVMPSVLNVTTEGVNQENVVTGQIDNLLVLFAGKLTVTPPDGVKSEVLVHSTDQSQLVDGFSAPNGGQKQLDDLIPSGEEMPIAVRLSGTFKTAFPAGKPAPAPPAEGEEPKPEPENPAAPLKESVKPGNVIIVADSDVLADQWSVQSQNIFGQRMVIPISGNGDLTFNIIDSLSGDSNLIGIRSRGTVQRPFTRIQKMEAAAQDQYRDKLAVLEGELQEATTRLQELQVNKEPGQKFILSPEQQTEIEKFQQKEAEVKKELKEVRRTLRRDTDKLRNFLTWMNILAMPVVVIAAGAGVAIGHRRMQKASS